MLSSPSWFDLRGKGSRLPAGHCVYIQSGDPGDFDGYFIAAAGNLVQAETTLCKYVIVIPERRACADRAEEDSSKHDPAFSEQVMATAGAFFGRLCPQATLVRGPLNTKSVIPLKYIFSEPEQYGPLLLDSGQGLVRHTVKTECFRTAPNLTDTGMVSWTSVDSLAAMLQQPEVSSVIMDVNGAIGYLPRLLSLVPDLGLKLKASGWPITIMAGVVSHEVVGTLAVPGRDPRATMNVIYHPEAMPVLLSMARAHSIKLLFVTTNNVCNQILRFQDAGEVVKLINFADTFVWSSKLQEFELQGLLKSLAEAWYGPHLAGRCVPFDWVSFMSMLVYGRAPNLLTTKERLLYVGDADPSILVLHDPSRPACDVSTANLEGTTLWGTVDSVVALDRDLMLWLARQVSKAHPT